MQPKPDPAEGFHNRKNLIVYNPISYIHAVVTGASRVVEYLDVLCSTAFDRCSHFSLFNALPSPPVSALMPSISVTPAHLHLQAPSTGFRPAAESQPAEFAQPHVQFDALRMFSMVSRSASRERHRERERESSTMGSLPPADSHPPALAQAYLFCLPWVSCEVSSVCLQGSATETLPAAVTQPATVAQP